MTKVKREYFKIWWATGCRICPTYSKIR